MFASWILRSIGHIAPPWRRRGWLPLAVDDLGDDVSQVGPGLNTVEVGRFKERGDGRPVSSTRIRAGEQRIFSIEGDRPDGTLWPAAGFVDTELRCSS